MNDELVLVQHEIPRPKGEPIPQMPFVIDYVKVERMRRETAEFWSKLFGETRTTVA